MDAEAASGETASSSSAFNVESNAAGQRGSDADYSLSFMVSRLSSIHEKRVQSAVKVFEAAKEDAVCKQKSAMRFSTKVAHPLRHFWQRPRLRKLDSEHDEEHIHEHWIELFNDLIMVAMLSNLSHIFEIGGNTVTNHVSMIVLWIIMIQSLHSVSFVVNLWNMDDLFTLFCCFGTTLGSVWMAAAVKSDVHPPCTAAWVDTPRYVQRFDRGALISQVSQFALYAQAAIFNPNARDHVAVMLTANICIALVIVFMTAHEKYVIVAAFCASSYFICWKFTTVMELLDLQHLRGRADLMVLVSLGEWVITCIIREIDVVSLISQTSLDLMLAAEYFNTKQHGDESHDLALSTRTPMDLLYLNSWEYTLQYAIALCLFFLPASVSVGIDMQQYKASSHGHADPHSRAMSSSSGSQDSCITESGWTVNVLRWHSASILCITRLLLLSLRHVRKCKIEKQSELGYKFHVRLGLCLSHLAVPWIYLMRQGESGEWYDSLFGVHAVIVFVDVVAELSIHQLAARRVRRLQTAISNRLSRATLRPTLRAQTAPEFRSSR
ncbi:unnamed protein product [Symbiodinium microadriaticum]|nr:unnamed protein product [Symbiodinium microadriaticum]CAE7911394.1 unnamed protein product [Symbiodinium sp. KB8]